MANNWEKAVSILVGNLNSGLCYLITTVFSEPLKQNELCLKKMSFENYRSKFSFRNHFTTMWLKQSSTISLRELLFFLLLSISYNLQVIRFQQSICQVQKNICRQCVSILSKNRNILDVEL